MAYCVYTQFGKICSSYFNTKSVDYLRQVGNVFASVCHLFVLEHHYMKSFQVLFMKPCRIMDYCNGNKKFNFGDDPIQWQPFWISVGHISD